MSEILNNFTFIGEMQIILFVQDIFDALFSILDSDKNRESVLDSLVFSALVFILGIITDKRFTMFRPVLDVYIEMHFSGAMAHKHLVASLRNYLSDPTNQAKQKDLRSSMKALEYIFKFIIQSRILQRNQDRKSPNSAKTEEEFRQGLLSLFQGFNQMMSKTNPILIGLQNLALQNFSSIFKELAKVFEPKELVSIAAAFIESVHIQNPTITVEKLRMIRGLVNSVLFENPDSRPILAPVVRKQIDQHMILEDQDSMRHCISILSEMLNALAKINSEVETATLLTLLPRLFDSYKSLGEVEGKEDDRDRKSVV